MINSYAFGQIVINKQKYVHDVIVTSSKVKSWWRTTSHEVNIKDLDLILEENPTVVIFGTGALGAMMVLPEAKDFLEAKGIKVIQEKSADAIKEFNLHLGKEELAGAFHLTC